VDGRFGRRLIRGATMGGVGFARDPQGIHEAGDVAEVIIEVSAPCAT